MKENQIKVKRIKTNRETILTIKNNYVYTLNGKHLYCGCTGDTAETATPMMYKDGEVYCPNCHEKKVEIIQTFSEWEKEQDEKQRKRDEERINNRHIVEMGSDWECGLKYYGLSANIEYEDWLKVKKYFSYYRKGWSRGQELEWEYGEPTGWLTRNPVEVEEILVSEGLIKPQNTMKEIEKRAELARQEKAKKLQEQKEKKLLLRKELDELDEKIKEVFRTSEKRELSDEEADKYYYNCTYGLGTVLTYTIRDDEIIKCENMVDFKYGIAIPYSKETYQLIKEFYRLHNVLQSC